MNCKTNSPFLSFTIKQDRFSTCFKITVRTGFATGLVKQCNKWLFDEKNWQKLEKCKKFNIKVAKKLDLDFRIKRNLFQSKIKFYNKEAFRSNDTIR